MSASDARPLPTVIGPTENALRALLERTLAATAIDGYPSWVVLNGVDRANGGPWRESAAAALAVTPEAIGDVIGRLTGAGLMDGADRLTDHGRRELGVARSAVADATARTLIGVDVQDEQVARRVLDRIRHNAQRALAAARD